MDEKEEIRNLCDGDDCIYTNKEGICYRGVIRLRRLHCIDYKMDKPYLDAQLKAGRRALVFPVYETFEHVKTLKELDAKLDRSYYAPPEKAGEEEKRNCQK